MDPSDESVISVDLEGNYRLESTILLNLTYKMHPKSMISWTLTTNKGRGESHNTQTIKTCISRHFYFF